MPALGADSLAIRRQPPARGPRTYPKTSRGAVREPSVAPPRPMRSEVSPDGPEDFPVIRDKLHRMQSEEPTLTTADLAAYRGPSLVVGDDDHEIHMAHTLELREGLPQSQLAVVPGTGHGLFAEKPGLCNQLVIEFLTEDLHGDTR
jgi:pimeloyl-ACP methyl ester carboxylesterase